MAFLDNYPGKEFADFVSLTTYGDDCLQSVSVDTPKYNHTEIAEFFKKYDIGYTMAEKDAESVPYIGLEDSSFLKRAPVFSPELGVYMAALEEKSIFRSLMMGTKSVLSKNEQMAVNLDNSMDEFFRHGRGLFERRQQELSLIVKEFELEVYLDSFHDSYDDRIQAWTEKYMI
jgi:hypothetical protein